MTTMQSIHGKSFKQASTLSAEVEEGNQEYKFKLTNLADETLQHRITQLNWRLNEGNDEAVYQIGVEDDGHPMGLSETDLEESLLNLHKMARAVGCSLTVRQVLRGEVGLTAEVVLRRLERQIVSPIQVQVAMVGDADAGKSTLVGVLSTGTLDNGSGSARTQVLQHDHEVCSGLTSSVSQHNLYFSVDGNVLNAGAIGTTSAQSNRLRSRSEMELAEITSRVVSFIDLAGHQKYLKTTLHGLVSRSPDYCLLCISAKTGVQSMTSEHIGVACALKLPLVIAVTKIDTVGPAQVEALVAKLIRFLSSSTRQVVVVHSEEELEAILAGQSDGDGVGHGPAVVPIFLVSNVTGAGLQMIRHYFFHLPTKSWELERSKNTFVRVLGSFGKMEHQVASQADASEATGAQQDVAAGLGGFDCRDAVFLCFVQSGTLSVDDLMYVGPITRNGEFGMVRVRSIRVNDVPVKSTIAGQCATVKFVPGAVAVEEPESMSLAAMADSEVSIDLCRGLRHSPSALSLLSLDSFSNSVDDVLPPVPTAAPSSPKPTANTEAAQDKSRDPCRPKRRPASGLVLVPVSVDDSAPLGHWEFEAELLVINHPSKIRVNYEPVVHIGCIKQSARIVSIHKIASSSAEGTGHIDDDTESDEIGNGERAVCRFRFLYHAEFVIPGSDLLVREGRTRGIGSVISII